MKAVQVGDVFFVESPFISSVSPKHEKHLAYLLGTISARPVIVIREPMHWDKYSTVKVIPSVSGGDPAINLKLEDRYGRITPAVYNFMPQHSQTIPVGRLGRRIGTLEPHELEEVQYAHTWINDTSYQCNNPVPECFREVLQEAKPASWRISKDGRSDVKLNVDNNMTITSGTNPEMNGMVMDLDIKHIVSPSAQDLFANDPDYHPEAILVKDGTDEERERFIPVEKEFPKSIFSTYDLHRVANRFNIDEDYYTNNIHTRDPDVLTYNEISQICNGRSMLNFAQIKEIYRTMYPLDAFLLGPRLPSRALSELLHISYDSAVILKLICNAMLNMDEQDYNSRLQRKLSAKAHDATMPLSGEISEPLTPDLKVVFNGVETAVKVPTFDEVYPQITDHNEQSQALSKIRQYLNQRNIRNIHKPSMHYFVRLPEHIIRRAYTGKAFKSYYDEAYANYKRILTEELGSY